MEQNLGNWVMVHFKKRCKRTGLPETGRLDRDLWETLISTHDDWLKKKGFDSQAKTWLTESKKKPARIVECSNNGKLPASWLDGSILDEQDETDNELL